MKNRLKHKAADSKRTATQESRYRLWQTQMENNETHTLVHTGIATSEHAECLTERNINGSRQNIQYEKESQTYGNGSPKRLIFLLIAQRYLYEKMPFAVMANGIFRHYH